MLQLIKTIRATGLLALISLIPAFTATYELRRDKSESTVCQDLTDYMKNHDVWSAYQQTGSFFTEQEMQNETADLFTPVLEPAPLDLYINLTIQSRSLHHNMRNSGNEYRYNVYGQLDDSFKELRYEIFGTADGGAYDEKHRWIHNTPNNPNDMDEQSQLDYIFKEWRYEFDQLEQSMKNREVKPFWSLFDINNDGVLEKVLVIKVKSDHCPDCYVYSRSLVLDEFNNLHPDFYIQYPWKIPDMWGEPFIYQGKTYSLYLQKLNVLTLHVNLYSSGNSIITTIPSYCEIEIN